MCIRDRYQRRVRERNCGWSRERCNLTMRKAAPKAGVRKQKQPNEVSKFGTLPGSTHCQLDFPVADRSLDHSTLHSAQVTRSIAAVKASIDPDVLGKNKKQWNAGVLPGNRPAGVYRFPDPALKRRNSAFQSIPQYETNYRSDYIAKFNGPVKPNDSRRGYNITDLRDETRMLTDDLEWTNDKGQRMSGTVKPTARKQGEQPWSKKPYDKPAWNVSVEQDFTERHAVDAAVLSKAVKNSETKKEQISATRMGLIGAALPLLCCPRCCCAVLCCPRCCCAVLCCPRCAGAVLPSLCCPACSAAFAVLLLCCAAAVLLCCHCAVLPCSAAFAVPLLPCACHLLCSLSLVLLSSVLCCAPAHAAQ
eukprot:TRINITY_DN3376_c0_g1_i4.p1 TRINITY_DN3376_c0_g1~~TRINITY_DN3376_c0_g1_i4.p1  ORF type:complete len:397 (+),score=99.85 TRINITY_DN3376_c0_g1_i4:108-1193(+)